MMPVAIAVAMFTMAAAAGMAVAVIDGTALPVSGNVQQIPEFYDPWHFICFFPSKSFFRH